MIRDIPCKNRSVQYLQKRERTFKRPFDASKTSFVTFVALRTIKASHCEIFAHRSSGDKLYEQSTIATFSNNSIPAAPSFSATKTVGFAIDFVLEASTGVATAVDDEFTATAFTTDRRTTPTLRTAAPSVLTTAEEEEESRRSETRDDNAACWIPREVREAPARAEVAPNASALRTVAAMAAVSMTSLLGNSKLRRNAAKTNNKNLHDNEHNSPKICLKSSWVQLECENAVNVDASQKQGRAGDRSQPTWRWQNLCRNLNGYRGLHGASVGNEASVCTCLG